ncbi:MAG: flippase [Ignavibacteriaceae bacterium]
MFWVLAGQTLSVVLGFLIIKLLSTLGPEQFGTYALILTVSALLGLIIYGPLAQGFIRFYYYYEEKELLFIYTQKVFRFLFRSFLILVILSVILLPASRAAGFYIPAFTLILGGLFITAQKNTEFFNAALNIIRKRKQNTLIQASEKLLIILLLVIFHYYELLTLQNALLALFAGFTAGGVIKFISFKSALPEDDHSEPDAEVISGIRKNLFAYVLPFLLWGFSGWLQLNGEKWIINELLSTTDVGVYSVMMALVNAILVVPNNAVSEFATPIIFKQYSDPDNPERTGKGSDYIKLTITAVVVLTLISTLAAYLFSENLILIISNESFVYHHRLLPLLCAGTGFFLIGQAQTLLGMALNKPMRYLKAKVFTGVISVFLNLGFVFQFGFNGVPYAITFTGIIYSVYIHFINKSIMNRSIREKI